MAAKQRLHSSMSQVSRTKTTDRERRQGERREMASDGFAYITTVGWICRREQSRRDGDKMFL